MLVTKRPLPNTDEANRIALENVESWSGKFVASDSEYEGEGIEFQNNDLLFGKLRPYLAKVYLATKAGLAIGDFYVLRCSKDITHTFLAHLLRSKSCINIIDSSTYGAKMPRASWEFMGNLPIPLPPLNEQHAIAAFLDYKTAQIDSLIDKKRRMIELLKEKRTALISHAVTKGLNPDAPMKDSGVPWLGQVPAHWEVKRLKFVVSDKLRYGANESAELDDPALPRYIRITDFGDDGKLRPETFKSLEPEKARDYMLMDGDILFARSGATVGKTFIFKDYQGVACHAGYLIRARPDHEQIVDQFLYTFTKSSQYDDWKSSVFIQATIENIGADKYQNLLVPVPPIEEQKSILNKVHGEMYRIDVVISATGHAVEKLQEYRTAIITAAVIGQIDVRNHGAA
ncbi:MAG: restriction endonuclease subunit S [Spirochaetes bacterium]|nr:restriction endonuclease subunit S [Spirochaetota bacterium]